MVFFIRDGNKNIFELEMYHQQSECNGKWYPHIKTSLSFINAYKLVEKSWESSKQSLVYDLDFLDNIRRYYYEQTDLIEENKGEELFEDIRKRLIKFSEKHNLNYVED